MATVKKTEASVPDAAVKAEPVVPYGTRFRVTRVTRKLVGEEWRETVALEPLAGPTVGFSEGDHVLLSAAESKPEAE